MDIISTSSNQNTTQHNYKLNCPKCHNAAIFKFNFNKELELRIKCKCYSLHTTHTNKTDTLTNQKGDYDSADINKISYDDYINKLPIIQEPIYTCEKIKNHHKNKGVAYCESCKIWLCKECLEQHNLWIDNHEMLIIKENKNNNLLIKKFESFCNKHNTINDYYCINCSKLLCEKCLYLHRRNLHTIKYICDIDKLLSEGKKSISEGHTFLDSYTLEIKEKYINALRDQIKKIEEAYEIYKSNSKKIFDFYNLMLSSYSPISTNPEIPKNQSKQKSNKTNPSTSYEKYTNLNILSTLQFNRFQRLEKNGIHTNEDDIKELISYYTKDFISYSTKHNLEVLATFPQVNELKSICLLNDGRIAYSIDDTCIKIIRLSQSNEIVNEIQTDNAQNFGEIFSLCQLENGKLISCSDDSVRFWKINQNEITLETVLSNVNNESQEGINKLIPLKNNKMAACYINKLIKIYNSNEPYELIKVLEGHCDSLICIYELINKNVLISGSWKEECLKFWDLDSYKCLKTFKNINSTAAWNSIIEINNSQIIIGERETIRVINVDTYCVDMEFNDENIGCVYCFCLINENEVLFGNTTGELYNFNICKKTCKEEFKNGGDHVNGIIALYDGRFVCVANDQNIRVHKYCLGK